MMNKQDVVKIQSFVLRVNVHCDGCKQKIKKQLQKIDGVYKISIDAEQGKVAVSGTVDPSTLIKKLEKAGKHAELWGSQKSTSNSSQNLSNSSQNNSGGGKDHKSPKGGSGKDQPKQQKQQQQLQPQQLQQQIHPQQLQLLQQQLQQQQMLQQLKGNIKDQKVPSKDPRTVKFNLPEDDYGASDDDEFDDEFDEDDYEDEYDDDEDYDYEEFGGHHHHNPSPKMIPIAGKGSNGGQSKNDKGHKGGGGGGKDGKKGDVIDVMKDMGGKKKEEKSGGNKDGKKDKKKEGGGGKIGVLMNMLKGMGGGEKRGGGHGGGGAKNGGGDGKKNKNGGGGGNKGSANDGGGNGKGNGKKGGGKNEGSQGMKNAYQDHNVSKQGKWVGGLHEQMDSFPAVQGLPAAMNGGGGYHQGMRMAHGPGAANPYNNQQYMAMMMNQQRTNGYEMFHPMYASAPPMPMSYMPPMSYMGTPMPSHPMADPYTHVFDDENTDSCSIM